jgi:hypothetical protein
MAGATNRIIVIMQDLLLVEFLLTPKNNCDLVNEDPLMIHKTFKRLEQALMKFVSQRLPWRKCKNCPGCNNRKRSYEETNWDSDRNE